MGKWKRGAWGFIGGDVEGEAQTSRGVGRLGSRVVTPTGDPEVRDDRWGPPISERGERGSGAGHAGQKSTRQGWRGWASPVRPVRFSHFYSFSLFQFCFFNHNF
jgi:hypothetical protein